MWKRLLDIALLEERKEWIYLHLVALVDDKSQKPRDFQVISSTSTQCERRVYVSRFAETKSHLTKRSFGNKTELQEVLEVNEKLTLLKTNHPPIGNVKRPY